MNGGSLGLRLWALGAVCVLIVCGSALLGYSWIGPGEILAGNPVFWEFRVPRVIKGALAGAGLALGGALLQALFRNPLASPFTLGIASGASLGAAAAFFAGLSGYWLWVPKPVACAFLGATGALGLLYLMSRLRAGRDMSLLLLAGVCVSYLCAAGVMLITFLAGRAVTNDIVVWMMGALHVHRPAGNLEIAALLAPTLLYACAAHRALDLLLLGEQIAASRGLAVEATLWATFVLVGALTAAIAANCGPIAFVGLMAPHMARALVGVRTLPLVIACVLVGAAFLSACDGLVRLLAYEPPVGVLTSMIGAVFFFYLLATRDARDAARP